MRDMKAWLGVVALGSVGALAPLGLAGCPCQGAACNKPDAGPPPECVPDNDFSAETAQSLTPGTATTGRICPALDQDFFRFTTANLTIAELTLTTTAAFSAVDLNVSITSADGTAVATTRDNDGSDGPTTLRVVAGLQPNSTYVVIVGDVGNDDVDDRTQYSLNVSLSADPDTKEPNPDATPSTADVTAAGNVGWLSTTGDVDAFSIAAAAGSILRFSLAVPTEATIRPTATLINAAGTSLYVSPSLAEPGSPLRRVDANIALKGAGPFRLLLSDTLGGADFRTPEGRYTLLTEVVADPDEDERPLPDRNDTLVTPIKVNNPAAVATRRPALSTLGDQDHYMVTINPADALTGKKILEVTAQMPAGTPSATFQPTLSIWDAVLSINGSANGNCLNPVAPGASAFLCTKPCSVGGQCTGQGSDQQQCVPADPAAPNVDRYCSEARLYRVLKVRPDGSISQSLRYPIRSGRNPVVLVSDQLSDGYDERPLTLTFQIVDDPDIHDPDDLPPALVALGGSGVDVRQQDLSRFSHSTLNSGAGHPSTCPTQATPDGGIPDGGAGCLGRTALDGGSPDPRRQPINCAGFQETTMEVTGYLAYDGDHDYYRFTAPPGFYATDIEYTYNPPNGGTTPVEITMFMYHANAAGDLDGPFPLRGSFVRAQQVDSVNANVNCQFDSNCPMGQECRVRTGQGVCKRNTGEEVMSGCSTNGDCPSDSTCRPNGPTGGVCRGDCVSNLECVNPDAGVTGAVCIERRCFQDEDNNPGTGANRAVFGASNNSCLFLNQCNPRPFYVEVVDNGLNDSDRVTPYTLRVKLSCGCPQSVCNAGVCSFVDCAVGN